MDRSLQKTVPWWIIFLFSVSTLAESRLVYNKEGTLNPHAPVWTTYGSIHPESMIAVKKQQQSSELSVSPPPVLVKCHPSLMEIVVQGDMFDTGIQIDSTCLRLGSDSEGTECRAVPSGGEEFIIQAQLMDCGTKLSSTKDKIIYSNVLVYTPQPSSNGLLRLEGATIPVECHYDKRYSVNAVSLYPTWLPLVTTVSSKNQIDFTLLLMTDDWQFERGSYTYYLGDPVHFEISAIIRNHNPLRVYIDRCVATATPDAETTLKYDFIEHHGCLVDANLTNSTSHFLPRVEEHKLRFQVDAFRFYQGPNNQVYVTCYVKAVPTTLTVSSHNRACSFIENRWLSVDGNDQACRSCDVHQRVEEPLSTEPPPTTTENSARSSTTSYSKLDQDTPEHQPATYVRFRPRNQQGQLTKTQQSPDKLMKREENYKAEQTVQLGPLIVLPSNKFVTRPETPERSFQETIRPAEAWST